MVVVACVYLRWEVGKAHLLLLRYSTPLMSICSPPPWPATCPLCLPSAPPPPSPPPQLLSADEATATLVGLAELNLRDLWEGMQAVNLRLFTGGAEPTPT